MIVHIGYTQYSALIEHDSDAPELMDLSQLHSRTPTSIKDNIMSLQVQMPYQTTWFTLFFQMNSIMEPFLKTL